MRWFEDENRLRPLTDSQSKARQEWVESGATEAFFAWEDSAEKRFQDRARIGALGFREVRGVEGISAWLFPVDGYPKVIGPKNDVVLFSEVGKIAFEGKWEDVPEAVVTASPLLVYLPYPKNRQVEKPSWSTRLLGAWRWLRHRKKGK